MTATMKLTRTEGDKMMRGLGAVLRAGIELAGPGIQVRPVVRSVERVIEDANWIVGAQCFLLSGSTETQVEATSPEAVADAVRALRAKAAAADKETRRRAAALRGNDR